MHLLTDQIRESHSQTEGQQTVYVEFEGNVSKNQLKKIDSVSKVEKFEAGLALQGWEVCSRSRPFLGSL